MILRDRVNDLLQANADLEREVAKLRYAHTAMQAAEDAQEDARSTRCVPSSYRSITLSKCCMKPS